MKEDGNQDSFRVQLAGFHQWCPMLVVGCLLNARTLIASSILISVINSHSLIGLAWITCPPLQKVENGVLTNTSSKHMLQGTGSSLKKIEVL